VADIPEFMTGEGKLHLAGVRDLYGRGLVRWFMACVKPQNWSRRGSMASESRPTIGDCHVNAAIETYWARMKRELSWIHGTTGGKSRIETKPRARCDKWRDRIYRPTTFSNDVAWHGARPVGQPNVATIGGSPSISTRQGGCSKLSRQPGLGWRIDSDKTKKDSETLVGAEANGIISLAVYGASKAFDLVSGESLWAEFRNPWRGRVVHGSGRNRHTGFQQSTEASGD
jgi:hypothetical protein